MPVKMMEPKPLTLYPWGEGIGDVRYFTPQIFMPSELKGMKDANGYTPQAYDLKGAVQALELTMKDAKPGVYFAANPQEGTYGKWNCAMKAAGWHQVPGCALNRVWGNWQAYKGPGSKNGAGNKDAQPWDSPDGFHKWIHAFYYIVPGRKEPITFDFTSKTRNLQASNGDADLAFGQKGSLWHINYGGSPKMMGKYNRSSAPAWCKNFARLSKSCGIALGHGEPDCGADLDEEFFTIAGFDEGTKVSKGWTAFLEYGGMQFAHNLKKIPGTAQVECPHKMEV